MAGAPTQNAGAPYHNERRSPCRTSSEDRTQPSIRFNPEVAENTETGGDRSADGVAQNIARPRDSPGAYRRSKDHPRRTKPFSRLLAANPSVAQCLRVLLFNRLSLSVYSVSSVGPSLCASVVPALNRRARLVRRTRPTRPITIARNSQHSALNSQRLQPSRASPVLRPPISSAPSVPLWFTCFRVFRVFRGPTLRPSALRVFSG